MGRHKKDQELSVEERLSIATDMFIFVDPGVDKLAKRYGVTTGYVYRIKEKYLKYLSLKEFFGQ